MVNLPVKVIHLDDDPGAVNMLRKLLMANDRVDYLEGFTETSGLYQFLKEAPKPDILFLDIMMSGKDGIQIAKDFAQSDIEIIFITAYAEYAVKAFEACAVDYLLKPVTPAMITAALDRFYLRKAKKLRNLSNAQLKELSTNYLGHKKQPQRIFITMLGKVQIVELEQVLYFVASDKYTHVYMQNGERHISSKPLRMYYDVLDNHSSFVRINRSTVVNKHYVKHILKDGANHGIVAVMINNAELRISHNSRDTIFTQLLS